MLIERNSVSYLVLSCPGCDGEGEIIKCSNPKAHDEKYDETLDDVEHKHTGEKCSKCAGLCLLLTPVEKLKVLGDVDNN